MNTLTGLAVSPSQSPTLRLTIGRNTYDVQALPYDQAGTVLRAYRLTPCQGQGLKCKPSYDVVLRYIDGHDSTECSCPDYLYRRAGVDTLGCKHVRSLRYLGML